MQDLYCSRKGNGSLQIELDSLKSDNERLLELLKECVEYADWDDSQIVKHAQNKAIKGMTASVSQKSTKSGKSNKTAEGAGNKAKKDNDWIPTQAVRAILQIRDQFDGKMSETCIS